jgi:hypothetical protein
LNSFYRKKDNSYLQVEGFLEQKQRRNWEFWLSAIIIALTIFLMIAYYNRWFSFADRIGPFRLIHYIAFAGTLYIAFGVILFTVLRRKNPDHYKMLLRLHSIGNLFAFMLISLHFAGQIGRPADFYPNLGTGLALYIGMVATVGTGLALRFNLSRRFNPKINRFIHVGLAFAFYLIIGIHILHGLNII